jgi:hypothetical protein
LRGFAFVSKTATPSTLRSLIIIDKGLL